MSLLVHNFSKLSCVYNIRKLLKEGTKVTGSYDIFGIIEITVVCKYDAV